MAGKKFAAEFALRRNVSALDKILIQDSDDDVVKYAYPPQIAALSGYAYAKSIADLPLMPTNKSIGYIVGQMLYIYVGMGGDTKDGLYQSVGFFVGPQGVQGEKGEQGERGEQGIQGPKGDNGGLSLQELDAHLATKQYVTADTLAEMLAGYVSNTSLMRDYVTIAKTQDVTGVKNFTAGLQFGGVPMYKSKGDTVFLDGNLVVRGGITTFGTNETITPSIFEALPIDGTTIKRDPITKELYVDTNVVGGGGTGGGGVADSVAWSNVTNKPTWITDTKPKYSYSEILDTPDLSVYAIKSSVDNALSGKADKATTLAGYGITNAYTKSEVNNIIDSLDDTYVTIAGEEQSITAEHNFVNGFKVGGLPIKKSQDKTLYLDANIVVSGAITMYGSGSTTFPTIWASIPFDSTMKWDGSKWSVVGGGLDLVQLEDYLTTNGYATQDWVTGKGYITGITSSMVTNALGYTPYNSSNPAGYITSSGSITGNAATATSAQYLYQSNIQESINYPRGADHAIKVVNCTSNKQDGFFSDYATVLSVASPLSNFQFGMYANPFATWASHPRFRAMRSTDGTWTDWKELAFVDDLNAYLPITGGTVSGDITANIYYANKGFVLSNVGDEYSGLVAGSHIPTVGNAKDIWLYNSSADIKVYTPTIFSVQGGNVAIGGSTATEKLHLYGNMLFEGEAALKSSLIGEVLYMSGSYLVIGGGSLAKGIPTYIDGQTVYVRAGNYVATFSDAGGLTWNGNLLATGGITCRDNFRTNDNYYGFSVKSQGGEDNWYGVKTYMQFDEGSTMGVCRIGTAYRHQGLAISFSTGNAYNYNIPSDYTYTDAMLLDKNGNLKIAGVLAMNQSSDERLKKNIRKVNASEVLMSLGGVWQYEYIDSEVQKNSVYNGTHFGLIYQNVKGKSLDKMCHKREDGMGALNYVDADFISIIAGATMENISEVEKLKRKIRTLENKVKQLEGKA